MSYDPTSPTAVTARARANVSATHLALGLLALTITLFLLTQVRSTAAQRTYLEFQIKNAETQGKNLVDAEKQLRDLAVQREAQVKQSLEIQTKYQALLTDVLELAKDDKDVKEVVENWKIQRSAPAATSETATPR